MIAQAEITIRYAPPVPVARILVVEDNDSDVFLLERALNKHHLRSELIHLSNGADALSYIRRQKAYAQVAAPDLILVDLNLSKHNGEEIVREIRSTPYLDGVPVCVWSSSQSARDAAIFRELGISRFITKPSGLDQFMEIGEIILDLLTGSKAA